MTMCVWQMDDGWGPGTSQLTAVPNGLFHASRLEQGTQRLDGREEALGLKTGG